MNACKRLRLLAIALPFLLSRPAAASWPADPTTNVPLCLATGHQGEPKATSDGKGGAIVAWDDQRAGNYDVYIQRVDATGTPRWALNGVPLCALANDQFGPALAPDGAGGAIIAWADNRGGSGTDLYVQRVDSLGVPKWTANGVPIAVAANLQWQPQIFADGSGGAILCWTDERAGSGFGRIYVQRVNSSGAPQWTANGVSTNNSPGGENYPWITSNGAGGAIVAWEDWRNGEQDIFAQRILSNGTVDPAWPIGGRAIATFWQDQNIGGLVGDGSGGALVTWPQWNGGTRDVYVHHVLATGALDPAWPAAGRKVSNDFFDQSAPVIVSDGAGGVLVSYFDYHGPRDVRAKRVFANGSLDPAWPDTGLFLCQSSGEKLFPAIVPSDTAAMVVWLDQRDGTWNIYGQRFFRTGIVDPAWPVDGRAITTANKNQVGHTVIADGAGGAILAWQDNRTEAGEFGDDGEIFAQAIKGSGQLGDPPVSVPGDATFDFALRSANPLRSGAMLVRFTLPSSTPASLEVFNVAGRRVAGREVSGAGAHALDLGTGWNAVPGVYFVRLSQGPLASVRRIILLD
jgi:hypothetical protein